MKKEHKLALIICYYLSKFDKDAYASLGFGNSTQTHGEIGRILDVNPNTIKHMRDQYDACHDNPRKGWYQRELPSSRQSIIDEYAKYSKKMMYDLVHQILYPLDNFNSQLSDFERSEIEYFEGELQERKVLQYRRNQSAVSMCKDRDRHTCHGCGFYFDCMIVECHHLVPLHMSKTATIDIESLITLCPTCHRMAHHLLKENYNQYSNKEGLVVGLKERLRKTREQ